MKNKATYMHQVFCYFSFQSKLSLTTTSRPLHFNDGCVQDDCRCCSWITLCFLSFSNLLLLYINIFLRNRCSCLLSFGITSLLKLIGEHTSNRMLSSLAAFTSEKESVTPQLRQSRPLNNSPRLSFPLSSQSHFTAALIYW